MSAEDWISGEDPPEPECEVVVQLKINLGLAFAQRLVKLHVSQDWTWEELDTELIHQLQRTIGLVYTVVSVDGSPYIGDDAARGGNNET